MKNCKKRACSLFLSLLIALSFNITSFSAANEDVCLSMALNDTRAYIGNTQITVNAPLTALGRMYVDLYETAPLLGVELAWVDANIPYYTASYGAKTTELHITDFYDNLPKENMLFVKNDRVFVAARDLAAIANATLDFDSWVITFHRGEKSAQKPAYGTISLKSVDSYIYETYCYPVVHPVYPYQAYSHEFMVSDAQKLQKIYPDLIRIGSIGKSVEGRDLTLIEFGKGSKKIFVCATHHAREYISTTYVMYAIDRYAAMYRTGENTTEYNIRDILDNVTFCIVPMVNPDGVNLVQNGVSAVKNPQYVSSMAISEGAKYGYSAWKANVNGVDVNWNYNRDWSLSKNRYPRGSIGFNGTQPETEPETCAVTNYVNSMPFEAFVSMHTQGKMLYWADDVTNPTYIGETVNAKNGFTLKYEKATGVGGSFFDYVYRNYGKATLTVELCNYIGPRPYPDADFDSVWKSAKDVLLIVGNIIKNR